MENGKDFRYNKDWSNGGKVGKYDLNNNLIEYVDASNLNIPDGYNSDWAYLENHEWIFITKEVHLSFNITNIMCAWTCIKQAIK